MNNKLWVTVAIIAISCAATGAIAQERLGDGALGAVAGAPWSVDPSAPWRVA